ncbi:MAG: PhzF family phenazine biosynthesis protein [Chloroflexi bacterium]|nr:MAG: PhzF family phenazine biosynthesis protein [Chloroflexota bacterium]
MRLAYVVCDVFTTQPLEGNALAVFPDGAGLTNRQMQALARELNLSESVFILPPERGGHARIRIFTPRVELPFAGHPTLGTALVLHETRGQDAIRLETGRGIIPVRFEGRGGMPFGWMVQPLPSIAPLQDPERFLAALGVERSELPVDVYDNGVVNAYVALPSEEAVAALAPDSGGLAAFGDVGANCFAGSGGSWKTRMFAPFAGISEDPATGSAAGPLALHLVRHGRIGWGDEIEIRQGEHVGRPSRLYARAFGDDGAVARIEVGGSAVVVGRGEFDLPE